MRGESPGPRPLAVALPDEQLGWVSRAAPASWRPYLQLARIDRPIGWWLLLLPCWWSAALAGIARHTAPNVVHLCLFFLGAVAMRGAGSTYNDIVDRDLDASVARTRGRPIASGSVSVVSARIFLIAQTLVGLAVLLCFNGFTLLLGIASLGIVALYPFMKRLTSWPQAVLGLAFAWGGLMGWAAAFGGLAPAPVLLYLAAIFWTMGYDTIYAVQDVVDDAVIGIGSTARRFGRHVRLGVGVLYALAVASAATALWLAGAGALAYVGLAAFALHLAWQTGRIDGDDPVRALAIFRSNRDAGLILFFGLAADAALKSAAA
ncbi:MAG: 4-hydroxybenzoate octaprenyltransferase [Methylobacteriaceae bacterium]|nr:4-hydroxybenzoate octaprenyltransferase [Methylobacteriaceae bacterium]